MPDDPRSVAWEQYRWHGADDAGGSERPPQWRYAFDAGWDACEEQYAARLQQAERDRAIVRQLAEFTVDIEWLQEMHEFIKTGGWFDNLRREAKKAEKARALYPPKEQP